MILRGKLNLNFTSDSQTDSSVDLSASLKSPNIETSGTSETKLGTDFSQLIFTLSPRVQRKVSVYSCLDGYCFLALNNNVHSKVGDESCHELAKSIFLRYLDGNLDSISRSDILYLFVCDLKNNKAILRSDNYGITKIYYSEADENIYFSNKADELFKYGVKRKLNLQSIYDYLFFHVLPTPFSMFEGVKSLEPGWLLKFDNGSISKERYWSPQYSNTPPKPKGHLKDLFLRSVKTNVDNIEKTGAFLSGGLDSSTVSGLLQELSDKPVSTFSIGFDEHGFDEIEYAKIAAKHFSTDYHEHYVTPEDVFEAIPVIASSYSEPFGNSSAVPTYRCAKLAASAGVKKILAGDGGDELFGGNERYRTQIQLDVFNKLPKFLQRLARVLFLNSIVEKIPVIRKLSSYVRQANLPMPKRMERYNLLDRVGTEKIFTTSFLEAVDTDSPYRYMDSIYSSVSADSVLNNMLGYDLKLTLSDNDLPKVATMCNAAGIEVGFPYFDNEMLSYAASLPEKEKTTISKLRVLFRKEVNNYLPDEILTKKKHGFGLPIGQWIMNDPQLLDFTKKSIKRLEGTIFQKGFVDHYLSNNMKEHEGYYGTLLWVSMILSEWLAVNNVEL